MREVSGKSVLQLGFQPTQSNVFFLFFLFRLSRIQGNPGAMHRSSEIGPNTCEETASGVVAEWSNAKDSKSFPFGGIGSNPIGVVLFLFAFSFLASSFLFSFL